MILPESAHTVVVVGAGASLAEALARRRTWRRYHPPLDASFFQRVEKYRPSPLLRRVVAQATKLGEPALTGGNPPVSLESYLGRLFFEVNHNPLAASVRAYFEAVELYARELTVTTNWMIGKAGLLKKLIQAELHDESKVTLVTFNIDLLLENALFCLTTARPRVDWDLSSAYGFSKSPAIVSGTSREFGQPFPAPGLKSRILTYKMHGSVNWVFKHRDPYPPADLVSKKREFVIVANRQLPVDRMTIQTAPGGRPWRLFPLIVPPVYEKHAFIRRHLQEVWDGATSALMHATKVVFWGYSFPLADTHARHFFQNLSHQNDALRRPVIINPDPGVSLAVWEVLRPDRVEQYRSADEYLA